MNVRFPRKAQLIAAFALALCGVGACQGTPTAKSYIGVLPVFDTSGEPYSEIFSQNLTFYTYQELQRSRLEAVLLNPGGLYSPLEPDWITDYGHSIGVDVVLITTLKPTEKPRNGDWILRVEYEVMDLSTGHSSTPRASSYPMDRKDLVVELSHLGWFSSGASRPFDKQPLGHAAKSIAEEIRKYIAAQAAAQAAHANVRPDPTPGSRECSVHFQVKYLASHSSSKAYGVSLNGREETLNMHEGVVNTQLRTGPLIVHVKVNDAPYKLPVQHLYQANTYLDCAQPEKVLVLEIGSAGDALLQWR